MPAHRVRRSVGVALLALVAPLLAIAVPQPASALQQTVTVQLGGSEQLGRMTRDGSASQCGAPKSYPGNNNPGTTYNYATAAFVAPTSGCLTVSVSNVTCVAPGNLFLSIYRREYHPEAQGAHYLGDQGASGVGAPSIRVDVEKGATYVVVASNTDNQESCAGDVTFDLADDAAAPDTAFVKVPPAKVRDGSTVLTFTGQPAEDTASFQCQVDGAAFAPCASPVELSGLSDGAHTVAVRAVDGFGNVDATPVVATFQSCDLAGRTLALDAANTTLAKADKAVAKAKKKLAKAKAPKARKKARKQLAKATTVAKAARREAADLRKSVLVCAR